MKKKLNKIKEENTKKGNSEVAVCGRLHITSACFACEYKGECELYNLTQTEL